MPKIRNEKLTTTKSKNEKSDAYYLNDQHTIDLSKDTNN